MVRQDCIPLDAPADWKEALHGIKHSFAHTWENCYAMHLTTGFKTYLYRFEADGVRIICPIAERTLDQWVDIVTPYGFSGFVGNGKFPEFPHYWSSFVKERGYVCGYISLNPMFENDTYCKANDSYQSNSLYTLDLTLSIDELFANLDRNRKRQLRNWEEISAKLIFDRSALTDFFLAHYHQFIRRVNASPAGWFSKETLAFLCGSDNVFMVGAGDTGKIEAVYLFAHTPYAGDCLFNVPLTNGRYHATELLWCGLQYLKSKQVPVLNMGGGLREADSIAQSKQRFGARRVPFRCLKQVYEPEIYEKLCRRVHADPSDITGYFPAYRKPLREGA